MKNQGLLPAGNTSTGRLVCFMSAWILLSAFLPACSKKDDNPTQPPHMNATACIILPAGKIYVDSVATFGNCSDSVNVYYLWHFGDGETSSARYPSHIYRNYGKYIVSLEVFSAGVRTDSTAKEIQVFIGEKWFTYPDVARCSDFAEGADSSVMVVGATSAGADVRFFLAKYDRNLRQKWVKYLATKNPGGSMERMSDGNFILPGSVDYLAGNSYSLTKIDTGGNVLWTRTYPQITAYGEYACEAPGGGIISVVDEDYAHPSGNTIPVVSLVKTDASGNLEWKRQFVGEWLMGARNLVATADGYLFASSTTGQGGIINSFDSLVITKTDLAGNIVIKKSVAWQLPNSGIVYHVWGSSVMLTHDRIVVINEGNEFVMLFDLAGNFIARNYSGIEENRFICPAGNERYVTGGGEWAWRRTRLAGLSGSFEPLWLNYYLKENSNLTYGYAKNGKQCHDGTVLVSGTRYGVQSDFDHGSLFLIRVNEKGEVQ